METKSPRVYYGEGRTLGQTSKPLTKWFYSNYNPISLFGLYLLKKVEIVFGRFAKYNNQEEIEDYFRDRNKSDSDRDLVD